MQKQNQQATVYYIHDCIIGHRPMLVGKAQIIKFFANNKIQKEFELNSWFKLNQEDLQIVSNKKSKILRRNNYLLEFENIQVINTNESDHYACYLNVAYHSLFNKTTNLNIIYRLDWYDRFDEEN